MSGPIPHPGVMPTSNAQANSRLPRFVRTRGFLVGIMVGAVVTRVATELVVGLGIMRHAQLRQVTQSGDLKVTAVGLAQTAVMFGAAFAGAALLERRAKKRAQRAVGL